MTNKETCQFPNLQLLLQLIFVQKFQVCTTLSIKGGRKRQVFHKTTHTIAIFKDELLDVQCLNFKVVNFDQEKVYLESKCKNLFELLKKENENEYLKARNESLSSYVDNLVKSKFENSGKKYDDLKQKLGK